MIKFNFKIYASVFFVLVYIICVVYAFCANPCFAVDGVRKSFGEVIAGHNGFAEFKILNNEDHPLTILGAKLSCSCMSVSALPLKIKPHDSGIITFKFGTRKKIGKVVEKIVLYTDSHDSPFVALQVEGTVLPDRSR